MRFMLGLLHHWCCWRCSRYCHRKSRLPLWVTTRWLLKEERKSRLQRWSYGQCLHLSRIKQDRNRSRLPIQGCWWIMRLWCFIGLIQRQVIHWCCFKQPQPTPRCCCPTTSFNCHWSRQDGLLTLHWWSYWLSQLRNHPRPRCPHRWIWHWSRKGLLDR